MNCVFVPSPPSLSPDELLLVDVVGTLPWPVMVIREDGTVLTLSRPVAGCASVPAHCSTTDFGTLFPHYLSALTGDIPWLQAQEATLTRYLDDDTPIHENIILRRTAGASYLIVVDQTRVRTLEIVNIQTARLAALGFMMAGVCHEISNPIAAIHSMVQILRTDREVDFELLDRGLASIAGNVKRVLDISHRLLNFGRVGDEPRCAFALGELLQGCLAVVSQDRRADAVEMVVDTGPTARVFGSSSQLQKVFINLLDNALQAMEGRGTLFVTVKREQAGRILVEIRDTGPGLSREAEKRLFEPFFTTKVAGRGSGLGLAICYEIVSEHAGTITAQNHAAGGACFHIDLPLCEGSA